MSERTAMPHQLPPQPTTFIGRRAELADLATYLADPARRLVTIIGPGGAGKTRLALEAAARQHRDYPDGVAFAPLQSLTAPDQLPLALAAAVGCHVSGHDDPRAQLLGFLRRKRLLLLVDNVEHLLDGAELLGALLAAAPGLRLLVTSREALLLQEEWRYPITGLELPAHACAGEAARYEAVQLFVERARRARHDFALAGEWEGVVRICRLVEGLPLALELAAAWTAALPCAAIADEIAQNLAFLATSLRNVPERHRSMRAIFEGSWTLLSAEERAIFQRLAVFRGGFRREAAERVAGANLATLAALADKSLIHYEPDGRYRLHALLHQYAGEYLLAVPDEARRLHRAHCAYFTDFLATRQAALVGGGQLAATAALAADYENIRAAWLWAVAEGEVPAIARAEHALTIFHDFRGRYFEGEGALQQAVEGLRGLPATVERDSALARLLIDLARMCVQVGDVDGVRAALDEGEGLYARLALPLPAGQMTDPLLWRGILALLEGDYAGAVPLAEAVLGRNTAPEHAGNVPLAWSLLAVVALWRGENDRAHECARQAHAAAERIQDRWYMAYCLNELGHVARARGAYAEATRHYQASYAIREAFDDPEGMAVVMNHLAKLALLQGEYAEARRLYERGHALYRDIADPGGLAMSLNGLGVVATATGDAQAAGKYLAQALDLVAETRIVRLVLAVLTSGGGWLLQTGRPAWGAIILAFARRHPASDQETRDRATQFLDRARVALTPEAFAVATRRGEEGDLETMVARLRAEFAVAPPRAAAPGPVAEQPRRPSGPALEEALTEREGAVLRLIASGLANKEIAQRLNLTPGTVKWYAQQIYGKLGVQSRTQAVARARECGLLD